MDNWLERTELLLGKEKLDLLRQAHVLVVGLGGVGAYAAEMIARAGVGRMTIADADTVAPSNINRQLVAGVVEEDVAFGPENLGIPPEEIRRRVDAALKAVDMYQYREHAPHKLSGGQKQRVAIAGIIAMETKCIVLDEPTAMLDPQGRTEVMETIQRLNREKGITIVLITHYMDEAVQAGRVVVMDEGNILRDGTPREVFSDVEFLKRHDLDVPQATELAYRLSATGIKLPGMPLGVEECVKMFRRYLAGESH